MADCQLLVLSLAFCVILSTQSWSWSVLGEIASAADEDHHRFDSQEPSSPGYEEVNGASDSDIDGDDDDEPQLEACPRLSLDDLELSACFTRVFKQDILPHVAKGIPQLGIRSIDPVRVPHSSYTILNNQFARYIIHVRDLDLFGSSRMSRSDIIIDTGNRTIASRLTFPLIEGISSHTTVEGHLLGIPVEWFTKEGLISFSIEGLSTVTTFDLRPTKTELVRLANVKLGVNGYKVQAYGVSRLRWIDSVINWFMRRYSLQLFEHYIRPGFTDVFTELMKRFMSPSAWRVIIGDFDFV